MSAVTIRIDGHAPDTRLASNQRGDLSHWERADLVNAEFDRALWLYKAVLGGDVARFDVPVALAFTTRLEATRNGANRRDVDNLSGACKPWLDALTLGRGKRDGIGLIFDDGPKWVRKVSYEVDVTKGEPYVEIRLEPIGEA